MLPLSCLQVSSVELERVVIASVPSVLEAAAVGITPPGGGPEQLVMFLVLDKHPKTVGSAQASQRDTDTSSQPAAKSAAHQSATHEQESRNDRQHHTQFLESSSSSSRYTSSGRISNPGSSSGHSHQPIPAQQNDSHDKPSSDQIQEDQSPGRTLEAAEGQAGSHAMAGQQHKHPGRGKATLTHAVATATSAAAGAVQRVGSAVSPLLKQAQHAAAPLTQQIRTVADPVLAQVIAALSFVT